MGAHLSRPTVTLACYVLLFPTRWSFLEIRDTRDALKDVGKKNTSDEEIAYLAGKMEGMLTASLMEMQWENTMKTYCTDNPELCDKVTEFLVANRVYVSVKDDTDPRWYQVTGVYIPLAANGLSCYTLMSFVSGQAIRPTNCWIG